MSGLEICYLGLKISKQFYFIINNLKYSIGMNSYEKLKEWELKMEGQNKNVLVMFFDNRVCLK